MLLVVHDLDPNRLLGSRIEKGIHFLKGKNNILFSRTVVTDGIVSFFGALFKEVVVFLLKLKNATPHSFQL